jgi:hypothetical protein
MVLCMPLPSPNATELAVAEALAKVWPQVADPAREMAAVLAAERERHVQKFEKLLQPPAAEVPRKVVSAQAIRSQIRMARLGG